MISFLPNPATLFITSWISSSLRLYFINYEILLKSSNVKIYFFSLSTKLNIAFLPSLLNGLPSLSVSFFKNVSKLTHYPLSYSVICCKAWKISLYFLSKPNVLAVFKISAISHSRRLSQYKLNILKKSSIC